MPNAKSVVWTMHPLISPAVVAIPLLVPLTKDCVRTYMLSGPGEIARASVAIEKEIRVSNINDFLNQDGWNHDADNNGN